MPTQQQHLVQAKHNEDFVNSFDLQTTPYLDWVVTGIYYAALHYVESYLALQGKHPRSDRYRDEVENLIRNELNAVRQHITAISRTP